MQVLHIAPHPDDELIGAPATLMALRDAGHSVVNFAASLGAPADAKRRRAELGEACRRAGFELVVSRRPFASTAGMDPNTLAAAERALAVELDEVLAQREYAVLVSPSPHDGHPAHELVGRAVRTVMPRSGGRPACWWMWSLWGTLPTATLLTGFGAERLEEVTRALLAHEGEIARNDFIQLVLSRAQVARVTGSELVFGFGSPVISDPLAELVCEVVLDGGRWLLGSSRRLDPREPLVAPTRVEIGWWLEAPSVTDRSRRTG